MNRNLLQLLYVSAIIYFIQGIESFPGSSVFFYFKETLHYNESTIMYLSSIIGLAWLIKPLLGYFIDNLKVSKRNWMLYATIASIAVCLGLGLIPILGIIPMIALMTLSSSCAAIRDVTNDGLMCQVGKKHDATGKIQAVQWVSITIASILTGIGGGWLAEHSTYQMGYLFLIPFYLILGYMIYNYNVEKPNCTTKGENFLSVVQKLWQDKNLLWVCLFIFLYNFAPSFGTPLSFVQRDQFHWSKQWMGTLSTIGAIFSIGGALLYYKFGKLLDIKKALIVSVFVGGVTSLAYLYFTPVSCVIYDIIFSVIGMFIQLMMLDFVARSTKVRMEAISFALFCSVINLASTCDNLVGAWLFPILGLQWLIILAAVSSFACLPLINRIKFK